MEKLERLFKECIREVESLGIRPSKRIDSVKVNKRAKRRLGCCKKVLINMLPGFQIEIASRLLGGEELLIKEVLIHEILHTCKSCFNHGKTWKEYAEKVNNAYRYHVSRTADYSGTEEIYRYRIVCKNCGNVIFRIRKSQVVNAPENYRCGKCKGPLEAEEYKGASTTQR